MSPDNTNVRITCFCSLLAELFLSCYSKRLFESLWLYGAASLSPRQIKSKEFERKVEPVRKWKRSVLALFLHQNTLSLSLSLSSHNYSPALFWTTLTESQTNMQCSLVWTCIIFAVDWEQKLFAVLFIDRSCYFFPCYFLLFRHFI